MAKSKFRQMLSWGWKGIEVWNFLSALGVAAILRGSFTGIVGGWAWHDQFFLFGGAFLLILGILTFVVKRRFSATDKSDRSGLKQESLVTAEQLEIIDWYEGQRSSWKSFIRLELIRVISRVNTDSPHIIFEFELRNYLPADVKLVKVTNSNGNISAGIVGSCILPALPETIEQNIGRCSDRNFQIKLYVHGTKIPEWLQSNEKNKEVHQWTLKGEWYVEIYGKVQLWQTQSCELHCQQTIY